MARKTTTVYTCDGCGKKVEEAKDLRRFDVDLVKRYHGIERHSQTDLCEKCEGNFLAAVEPFFKGDALATVAAMRRETVGGKT